MTATKPTAYVYLTESSEWFTRSELGRQLVYWEDRDRNERKPGHLRVVMFSANEGWIKCFAILKDPADPHDDLVEVLLPAHAVAGVRKTSTAG
ncbi:hypothetical protein AB0L82_35480 [Nocardia sp. NPDC052001]|uniref:hypothetical protein n=1 Tax=Nocardia sp. NPDC052001 TaxID=3154853 RepID=UPI0034178ACC